MFKEFGFYDIVKSDTCFQLQEILMALVGYLWVVMFIRRLYDLLRVNVL